MEETQYRVYTLCTFNFIELSFASELFPVFQTDGDEIVGAKEQNHFPSKKIISMHAQKLSYNCKM